MKRRVALAAALVLACVQPARPLAAAEEAHAHWTVSTTDPKAQDLFDRGLAMLYAFDVGEARVAFEQAAQRDPDLALAYWGLAEADTIDINEPSTAAGEVRGGAAAAKAGAHLAHASTEERALVGAIATRYRRGSTKQKFARYADAMSAFAASHRDEPNALVVAGFALYTAEDQLVDGKDAPTPKALEILADADRALFLEPANLGAHHLRIHLLESLSRAKDAVSDADALASYAYPPGESHLPHMAGHVWARVGDYDRLVADNERAVENDRAWFALGDGPGQEYMKRYHAHDVDFVSYGLTTQGRDAEARTFAAGEDAYAQIRVAMRLHDYARVAAIEPGKSGYVAVLHAIAAARAGDAAALKVERARMGADATEGRRALVEAAVALGNHDAAGRIAAYARVYAATKSDFPGDPKDSWPIPIGEGYAAALLGGGKATDAQTVFEAELKRFPNDPRLLWGLAEALKAQGKDDAAARAGYRAQWKGAADLSLDDLG